MKGQVSQAVVVVPDLGQTFQMRADRAGRSVMAVNLKSSPEEGSAQETIACGYAPIVLRCAALELVHTAVHLSVWLCLKASLAGARDAGLSKCPSRVVVRSGGRKLALHPDECHAAGKPVVLAAWLKVAGTKATDSASSNRTVRLQPAPAHTACCNAAPAGGDISFHIFSASRSALSGDTLHLVENNVCGAGLD